MKGTPLKEIANELPFLESAEERETLLGVIGALILRKISLNKASEIMGMERQSFVGFLDALGVRFSYLTEQDVETEKQW
jgi:predicted HTH domain antitoxin